MKLALMILLLLLLDGCQTGMVQSSGRNTIDKEGSMYVRSRVPGQPTEPPDIYVRKNELNISPVDKENDTGSLFNLEDERNYLYATRGPVSVGKYIDVQVASRRVEKQPTAANAPATPAAGQANDEATNAILKALPELAPAEASEDLIKRIQMRVVERLENGDVIAMARRASQRDALGNEINVRVRIPYEKLIGNAPVTTDDVADVHWVETESGQQVERYSSSWEDEYTLRFSGFTEAKSKLAASLDDKRKQLMDVRKRVETQAKTMGDERRKLAKEREALLKRQGEDAERIRLLEKQTAEQSDKIRSLTPKEEKPTSSANAEGGDAAGDNARAANTPARPANQQQKGG